MSLMYAVIKYERGIYRNSTYVDATFDKESEAIEYIESKGAEYNKGTKKYEVTYPIVGSSKSKVAGVYWIEEDEEKYLTFECCYCDEVFKLREKQVIEVEKIAVLKCPNCDGTENIVVVTEK